MFTGGLRLPALLSQPRPAEPPPLLPIRPRVVKKSKTACPCGVLDEPVTAYAEALIVLTGRCGCLRWFELLGAGLAAVAVNAVVLI